MPIDECFAWRLRVDSSCLTIGQNLGRRVLKKLYVCGALAVMMSSVCAEPQRMAVSGLMGYQTFDDQFKNDMVFGVGFGIYLTPTFELEWLGQYSSAKIKDTGSPINRFSNTDNLDKGSVEVYQTRVDLKYHVPTTSLVKPYLIGGFGVIMIEANGQGDNSNGTLPKATSGNFNVPNVGLGFEVPIEPQLNFRADARYLAWDMHHGVNEVDDLQLNVGVVYGFGETVMKSDAARSGFEPVPVEEVEESQAAEDAAF